MYLDPDAHAAFTGSPVEIGSKPGDAFRAFDGMLSGATVHTQFGRLIVQTWRSRNWADDAPDSVVMLTFWPLCLHHW
jgi:activator of HSP90 ATPase